MHTNIDANTLGLNGMIPMPFYTYKKAKKAHSMQTHNDSDTLI